MRYIAVHNKTKEEFEVIGKDSIGTLIKLRSLKTNKEVVSNISYYTIQKVEVK